MKITVDRHLKDDQLVFTITCSEPHDVPFGQIEKHMMTILETCKAAVEETPTNPEDENKLKMEIKQLIHSAKEKAFNRVQSSLHFAIQNELKPKVGPMAQEIYNWIYDHQKDLVKQWLAEFDPQRTKYYFDNDKTADSVLKAASHYEAAEDDEDDEE